ncbi:MAG: DNA-3-methyladenine glycosylase family protein [Candidatus Binataceae bacterium]
METTLGLRTDLTPFYQLAEQDAKIGKLVRRFAGFRPPRFPTVFEALANAIACQQLSLAVGIILLNRLARAHGGGLSTGSPMAAFPSPEQIAKAHPEQLCELGFSHRKAHALIGIAKQFVSGGDRFGNFGRLDDATALNRLLALRGIGRWSAEYVMLRGLSRLHVFPADDVAGQKNLHRWLGLRRTPSYERVRQLLVRWHPYEGLIYFQFLLANLEARGLVHGAD